MADSSGRELTHGRALTGALLFADWARANSAAQEKIGAAAAGFGGGSAGELGITLAGRVPVNLNFTAGKRDMRRQWSNVRSRDLTSKTFLEKAKLETIPGMIFVEDVLGGVSKSARFGALVRARLWPKSWLYVSGQSDQLATVIFPAAARYAQGGDAFASQRAGQHRRSASGVSR